MDAFEEVISASIVKEGSERYTNDPADKGGPTKWGITQQRARACGYQGDMRSLDRQGAIHIYRVFYWEQPMFDSIWAIDKPLGLLLLDLGINCGTVWPVKWLQRCLNVLNNRQALYGDLDVDGIAGRLTRASLVAYLKVRGADGARVLHDAVAALAGVRYITLAEDDPTQERFEYGWLANRAFPARSP